MSIVDLHDRLATSALLYGIIMFGWGLWRYLKGKGVDNNYRGASGIAELLYLIQGILGLFIFISGSGDLERAFTHILYGAVTVLVIPAIYIFSRGDDSRRAMLIYSFGFLFLIGINFRSMATGG